MRPRDRDEVDVNLQPPHGEAKREFEEKEAAKRAALKAITDRETYTEVGGSGAVLGSGEVQEAGKAFRNRFQIR
jgi:hypothetical protein